MASTPSPPSLVFNYDISCPFAYIASTRVRALAHRTNTTLIYRPVLLGAIYRATAAPQGAGGSASDVFNSAKKAVTAKGMQRTLNRYQIKYNPPPQHPRKTVNALRLLYCVRDQAKRAVLTDALFQAYWVEGRDVNDDAVLLGIAAECGVEGLDAHCFEDQDARKELADATDEAINRGAFGVPGFWIPGVGGDNQEREEERGRFFWGQDRMHFVEATLRSLSSSPSPSASTAAVAADPWTRVPHLRSLMPRCTPSNTLTNRVKLEFWFDFSSPWAFLGYTHLARLQRTFGPQLEIVLKPFLLGILFREIGAPNLPMTAISAAKMAWSRRDHADWTRWWNAVGAQEGGKDGEIKFYWTDTFPIRTPTVLRVGIVEPETTRTLFSACWEQNKNASDDSVLRSVLDEAGYDGADLIARANGPAIKAKLRALTAEAKELGLCGVPTYRVLRQKQEGGEFETVGGLVWGQDETNVVEDLIAGWDPEKGGQVAEVGKVSYENAQEGKRVGAKL